MYPQTDLLLRRFMGVTPKPFILEAIIIKDTDIHIRISNKDKQRIQALAKKSKLSLSEYMINSSIKAKIIVEADKSQYITELRRIGNNINQITKKVNQGILKEVNLKEVKQELKKIWQLLSS